MEDCHPILTPIEHKLNLACDKNDEICDKPYKQLIGCLMYAMLVTRPDLCRVMLSIILADIYVIRLNNIGCI